MVERQNMRRGAVMLGATVLGMVALMGANTTANAVVQGVGEIDFERQGSLTVHKYLHQTGTHEGDISSAPAAGDFTDPVQDVVFTVYPVLKNGNPIDLAQPGNWDRLKNLVPGAACTAPTDPTDPAAPPAVFSLGTGIPMDPTNADGMSQETLGLGAYQVCETFAPANIVDRAQPFILTVPMPHDGGWVYDVHAFPKNGKGEVVKTVDPQQETGLGSVMTFPVTAPIPTRADVWTGFGLTDTLDARLAPLTPTAAQVTVDGVALPAAYYTVAVAGQTVTMNFTAAGIDWLNTAPGNVQAGKKIAVVFSGTVESVGNGTITNDADLWLNNPNFTGTGIPSNTVETNWGDLEVQKRSAGTEGTQGRLNGAVFEIFNAVDPYAATCTDAVQTGSAISVNGNSQFTSEGTGIVSIAGLFVSDNVNPVIDAQQRCYVLVEVVAPAGYVLPADPTTGVAVHIGQLTPDNSEIFNTQQEVPELPLTGAAGQVLMIAGGAAAVAVAMGLVLMNRRRATASN